MDKETRAWADARPPHVRSVVLAYPPDECYLDEQGGHYKIYGYSEDVEDKSVSLKIVHGRGSFGAGTMVFGVPPDSLEPCGCGKWKPPTKAETAKTMANIKKRRAVIAASLN